MSLAELRPAATAPPAVPEQAQSPYARRDPEHTTLHRVVREHLDNFLARAAERDGHGLPTFVRRALQRYLDCGVLQKGFCRFRFHVIALDGVFSEQEGALRFHPARPLQNEEVAALLATVRARVERWLERAGLLDPGAHDELADEAPLLAEAYATSILGQSTLERPRAPIRRLGVTERPARVVRARALHAHDQGFDLEAGVRIAAQQPERREPLEKLLRYCARPPLADDRLELRADGRIALTLKTPWHDGTTQLELAPLDLLARCAALIPRPHKNLVVYHGVLAANARLRPRVVGYGRPAEDTRAGADADAPHGTCARAAGSPAAPEPSATPRSSRARASWADLMRRAFGHELLRCPRCGGTMRWLATILDHQTIARILRHLALPSEPVARAPARASPTLELFGDDVA